MHPRRAVNQESAENAILSFGSAIRASLSAIRASNVANAKKLHMKLMNKKAAVTLSSHRSLL